MDLNESSRLDMLEPVHALGRVQITSVTTIVADQLDLLLTAKQAGLFVALPHAEVLRVELVDDRSTNDLLVLRIAPSQADFIQ